MKSIADDTTNGLCCSHCNVYFKAAHGHPVLCVPCFDSSTSSERAGLPKAYIPEAGDSDDQMEPLGAGPPSKGGGYA